MRAALIDSTGTVVNVALIGDTYEPPDQITVVEIPDDSPVSVGWTYDGTDWTEGTPPEPEPPPPTAASLIQAQVDELTDLTVEMLDLMMGM